jgi:hypothetical protein
VRTAIGDERKLTGFPVHCTAPRANQAKVAKAGLSHVIIYSVIPSEAAQGAA